MRSDAQRWYVRRTLPYRATDRTIDGIIITFTDITEIRRKADEEIKARSALAESLERQVDARVRALRVELFKLAITEERERRAIATDLHDELCQPLAAASLRLTALPAARSVAARGRTLQTLTELVEKADRAARSLMFRISPPVLFDLGLTPALEWLAEDMQRTYGLIVKVSESGNVPQAPLDETVRSVLFRCVRELLANVAKHAKVDAAEVIDFPRRRPARGVRHRRRRRVRSGAACTAGPQGAVSVSSPCASGSASSMAPLRSSEPGRRHDRHAHRAAEEAGAPDPGQR